MSAVDRGRPESHVVPRLRRSIPIGHRAEALRRFGHSAHDAEFLTFAALLGGYFERRHYRIPRSGQVKVSKEIRARLTEWGTADRIDAWARKLLPKKAEP